MAHDPIKEFLTQQSRATQLSRENNSTGTEISRANYSSRAEVSDALHPIAIPGNEQPVIRPSDLEGVLRDFKNGQNQLQLMKELDQSYWLKIQYYIKVFFGGQKLKYSSMLELLKDQQQNVRALNYCLAHNLQIYTRNLEKTQKRVEQVISSSRDEQIRHNEIQKKIKPQLDRFRQAEHNLQSLDKEREPEKWHSSLKQVINAQRELRKKKFEYGITNIGRRHYSSHMENVYLNQALYETLVCMAMGMVYATELYQQSLDDNINLMEAISTITGQITQLSQAVDALSELQVEANEYYLQGTKDVRDILRKHPSRSMLPKINRDLNYLLRDLNDD